MDWLFLLKGFLISHARNKRLQREAPRRTTLSTIRDLLYVALFITFAITAFLLYDLGPSEAFQLVWSTFGRKSPPSGQHGLHFATVDESQREAVRLHPDLGVSGTRFNKEFLSLYKRYKQNRPDYFSDPSWPVTLAEETANTLKSK